MNLVSSGCLVLLVFNCIVPPQLPGVLFNLAPLLQRLIHNGDEKKIEAQKETNYGSEDCRKMLTYGSMQFVLWSLQRSTAPLHPFVISSSLDLTEAASMAHRRGVEIIQDD